MKGCDGHHVAYRLTAGAAVFDRTAVGQILKLKGAQIGDIVGLRLKFHQNMLAVFRVFSRQLVAREILQNIDRRKVEVFAVSLHTINARSGYVI